MSVPTPIFKNPDILCPSGLWAPPGEWELETVGGGDCGCALKPDYLLLSSLQELNPRSGPEQGLKAYKKGPNPLCIPKAC